MLSNLNKIVHENGVPEMIRQVEKKLDDLLESEELCWAQCSRALWLQHGDSNTRFFHNKASQRKSRNQVDFIFDDHGEKFTEEDDIAKVFTGYFQELFSSYDPQRIAEAIDVVQNRITHDMREILCKEFTQEDVYVALKSMKPTIAPRPDGMPTIFYQKCWNIVGEDISNLALQILNNGGSPASINHTFIKLLLVNS